MRFVAVRVPKKLVSSLKTISVPTYTSTRHCEISGNRCQYVGKISMFVRLSATVGELRPNIAQREGSQK